MKSTMLLSSVFVVMYQLQGKLAQMGKADYMCVYNCSDLLYLANRKVVILSLSRTDYALEFCNFCIEFCKKPSRITFLMHVFAGLCISHVKLLDAAKYRTKRPGNRCSKMCKRSNPQNPKEESKSSTKGNHVKIQKRIERL